MLQLQLIKYCFDNLKKINISLGLQNNQDMSSHNAYIILPIDYPFIGQLYAKNANILVQIFSILRTCEIVNKSKQ